MSVKLWLTLGASLSLLAGCATHQENPNYAYSTTYKAGSQATSHASTRTIQAAPVSYQSGAATTYASASVPTSGAYSRTDHACLRKEKNHELIGAALGGSLGAYAGKELIGGTKGTVIGAGLGGAAGYGIGDKTVNCDPQTYVMQESQSHSVQQASTGTYSSAPVTASTPQSYQVPATHQYASSDQSRVVYQSPRVEYQAPSVQYQTSHVEHQAPTDTQFENISNTGTPGYQVLQSQTISQPAPVAVAASSYSTSSSASAQLVDYDYSDNVISANTFSTPEYSQTRILGGAGASKAVHLVKEGDTVYSLARRICVSVNDIQSINGLNSNFGIKIGDTLKLPASRC